MSRNILERVSGSCIVGFPSMKDENFHEEFLKNFQNRFLSVRYKKNIFHFPLEFENKNRDRFSARISTGIPEKNLGKVELS